MPTRTKIVAGTGTIVVGDHRVLAQYMLKFPVTDPAHDDVHEVPVDSITGRLRSDIPISQIEGLRFEIPDRKLAFHFSFLGPHGGIRIEKWVAL